MLKPILSTLDGVAATDAAHYKEVEANGEKSFVLDVQAADGWELANTTGLKTALERERAAVKELKKNGGGKSPEDVAALEVEVEALKTKLAAKGGNEADAVKAAREELKAFHATELAELNKEKASLESSLHGVLVKQVAQEALASGGFKAAGKLMLSTVMEQMRVGRDAVSGELVTEVVDLKEDGKPRRIGGSDASWMTPAQLVAELKANPEYASFADGSEQSGGGTKSGGSERVQPVTNQTGLSPEAKLAKLWG